MNSSHTLSAGVITYAFNVCFVCASKVINKINSSQFECKISVVPKSVYSLFWLHIKSMHIFPGNHQPSVADDAAEGFSRLFTPIDGLNKMHQVLGDVIMMSLRQEMMDSSHFIIPGISANAAPLVSEQTKPPAISSHQSNLGMRFRDLPESMAQPRSVCRISCALGRACFHVIILDQKHLAVSRAQLSCPHHEQRD